MAYEPRAIKVLSSVSTLRGSPGPYIPENIYLLDLGAIFRFSPGSVLADDGATVIETNGAGGVGAWIRIREDIRGANITGSATITVGGKSYRRITALSANATLTLSTTNAAAGDWILFVRSDTSAYTVDIGGLVTMPVSVRSWAVVYFNGTAWEAGPSGLSL